MLFHSRTVRSLMLSSYSFLCLALCLPPCTVPSRIVLASPDDLAMCPYHFSFSLIAVVRRSLYSRWRFQFWFSLPRWLCDLCTRYPGVCDCDIFPANDNKDDTSFTSSKTKSLVHNFQDTDDCNNIPNLYND